MRAFPGVFMITDTEKELIGEIVELTSRVKKLRHLVKPTPYQIRKGKKEFKEKKLHEEKE